MTAGITPLVTDHDQVLVVLDETQEILKERWVQGAYTRLTAAAAPKGFLRTGRPTFPTHTVQMHCLMGAVRWSAADSRSKTHPETLEWMESIVFDSRKVLARAINELYGKGDAEWWQMHNIEGWNDRPERKLKEVQAVVKRAIELVREDRDRIEGLKNHPGVDEVQSRLDTDRSRELVAA